MPRVNDDRSKLRYVAGRTHVDIVSTHVDKRLLRKKTCGITAVGAARRPPGKYLELERV